MLSTENVFCTKLSMKYISSVLYFNLNFVYFPKPPLHFGLGSTVLSLSFHCSGVFALKYQNLIYLLSNKSYYGLISGILFHSCLPLLIARELHLRALLSGYHLLSCDAKSNKFRKINLT